MFLRVSPPDRPGKGKVTTATEHARTLLAAIIPDRRDLLDRALRHLNADHFPDRMLANIFTMLERYTEVTGAILTRDALGDILKRSKLDVGTIASYQETFDELRGKVVDEASFRWSLEQIRELAAERATGDAITQGMEILTRGAQDDQGQTLKGHQDARTHVMQQFAEIDRDLSMQEAPEGDMRTEGNDILADYAERERAHLDGRTLGVKFGIPALDDKTGGMNPGELVLIVGFSSDGKTSMAIQTAWSAVVEQGKNVVFLTTETVRSQVRRRLIARHSCHEVFGMPMGLNSRDIKNGTLSPDHKDLFHKVVLDFNNNPAYGRCYISQMPRGASFTYAESKLARIQRQFQPDLIIVDYLALFRPERKRSSDREELSGTLKAAKQFATTFNDGAGVPLISPWQVNRSSRVEAERVGYYTLNALSETAESTNSADQVIGILAPMDNENRIAKIKAQVMKNRDGEKANSIELRVDYATCKFSGDTGQRGMDSMFDPMGLL